MRLALLFNKKKLKRKVGSGRIATIATKATIKKITKYFNHRSGRSQKKIANRFKTSHSYVSMILKEQSDIRCYKKQSKPLMTALQMKAARPKCRKLNEKHKRDDFILDDESYFTLSNSTLAGNDRFYSNNLQKTPLNVKNKFKAKFEAKVLVWVAISPRGKSKALFFKSGLAINQTIYKEQCLDKGLLPFIAKYYPRGGYVFWPDLASSHYAKSVCNHLESKGIEFVPKTLNPANVPKARPIEDFWAILKQKVYYNNWTANSIAQLKKRISWSLSKIDTKLIQSLARDVHKRLEIVARRGVEFL